MPSPAAETHARAEEDIRALYESLLEGWNRRDAAGMAKLMAADGNMVGFDGSPLNGPADIEATLANIFAHHPTPPFVWVVWEVRLLGAEVGLLRAAAGMVPPGRADINPALNAIQTLIAVRKDGVWRVAMFQNTPAAFHGSPESIAKLNGALRAALAQRSSAGRPLGGAA